MWSRQILKSNAKIALTGRYWRAFVVALLAGLLTGIANLGDTISNFLNQYDSYQSLFRSYDAAYPQIVFLDVLRTWVVPLTVFGLLLSIFVINNLRIGEARYFVQNHFGETHVETLFSGFRNGYGNSVVAMFVTDLFIFLWSLLLLIPGIYKTYQYYMVPYILSDNPNIPGARARSISRAMTDGEKLNIFLLELSFIGWYLLGGLCLGIGVFFVNPYYEATKAELYIYLRDRAIQTGMVQPEELGLVFHTPGGENPFGPPPSVFM